MKIHRFIGTFAPQGATIRITEKELVHQISRVLKLEPGEHVILSDGNGSEWQGMLSLVSKGEVIVSEVALHLNSNEPAREVTLYLAILKKDNFELAIQKAVEVGVCRIVPIITERTVKSGINTVRLETIIREAAEQSGRGRLPVLEPIASFQEALKNVLPSESVLFDLSGTSFADKPTYSSLFIGPEGGFAPEEIMEAKNRGLAIASLGALTMRGETAAIVASYLITRG